MSLHQIFLQDSEEIEKNAHYFSIYERYLGRFVNKSCILFVIIDSIHAEAQARMWARYLGGFSTIVCLTQHNQDNLQLFCRNGNARDIKFINAVVEEFGRPDIVIDDGSHMPSDIIADFQAMIEIQSPSGLYFVEDIYTSYWKNYQGGLLEKSTFIEYAKSMIDEMHACHTGGAIPPNSFSNRVLGIHIYDGIAVFELGQCRDRRNLKNIDASAH